MKMDKLRLAILQAKLSHSRSQFGEALRYWTEAMSNLSRFTLVSGRTTRIILLSQCHVLRRQGLFDIERRTRDQMDALEECADTGGALYWISGLRIGCTISKHAPWSDRVQPYVVTLEWPIIYLSRDKTLFISDITAWIFYLCLIFLLQA